ncbi:four helix bundle protein [Candidatus Roizmanbacteria bacterium]|nr:four helix bundle protein [Candidatus Roizmanbacteria bacterium]
MTKTNTINTQLPISKKEFDIHKRIFNFVVRVLKLTKALPKTQQNLIFINQITRSVTSMGANDQEADGSMSRKEFFHSMTIVKKETKETNYWLRVISELNGGFKKRMEDLIKEGEEIEAIVSSIVEKSKN